MEKALRPLLAASGLLALSAATAEAQAPPDALAAAPQLAAAPSVTISNGLVAARILLPDAKAGFYRGTRFDWAGVVESLTYAGQEFYGPWFTKTATVRDVAYDGADILAGPNSAITGPADEFDMAKPLGWDDAGPGGVFVKIGVGVLRRPDAEPYAFARGYEIVDPGRRTFQARRDAVSFTHDLASPETGYAYSYEKTLSLPKEQARMVVGHRLRNSGRRAITTVVYNHNFLTFGGAGMREGLTISAPFPITSGSPPDPTLAALRDGRLVYLKTLADRERVFTPIEGFGAAAADNSVRIEDGRTGASVTFQGDVPLTRVQLWSIRSVVSVEPFTTLTVEPGQEVRWSYDYRYEIRR